MAHAESHPPRTEKRSLALINARVHTMDASRPRSSGLELRAGRIASLDPTLGEAGAIDLGGATVLPGLIDSHLHLELGGQSLLRLDLSNAGSRDELERAIATRHRDLPNGSWLIGGGWNEDSFSERVAPDATWLTACGNRPAVCWRMDQHACVVNATVLRILASHHDLSRDPPGGRILRDTHGQPTGLLQEAAAWQLLQPLVPSPTRDDRRRAVLAAHEHLAGLGLTSVGAMEYASIVRDAIEPQRSAFRTRMRVTLLDRDWPLDLSYATKFRNDDLLAVIGMKAFVDGTLGSRTARMLEDYTDDAGNRGLLVELAERGVLSDWVRLVRSAGLSPSMHAIGDEAARLALDALDASDGADAPWGRIEHAQTIEATDIPRFRGRFASMQPLHKAYDARSAQARLGPSRMRGFFPFLALKQVGARLAFGSDWPIVSADPIRGIAAAVTGLDLDGRPSRPEDSVSVHDALVAYTRDAAACLGMREAGMLRVGHHADCTILDRDPYACDWVSERPRVIATIMGGEVTYAVAGSPLRGHA